VLVLILIALSRTFFVAGRTGQQQEENGVLYSYRRFASNRIVVTVFLSVKIGRGRGFMAGIYRLDAGCTEFPWNKLYRIGFRTIGET
jgi:hypothetical protein